MIEDATQMELLRQQLQLKLPEKYVPWKPTPHQAAFLLVPHKEAFFGGSTGGGKSIALLMAALMYVDDPKYKALILRRSFSDLNQPGALIDIAHEWLGPSDAVWNESKHQWTFPSGAILKFGYMDTEKDRMQYQGAQYQFIGYDELTQFTEPMYTYLFSRMRKQRDNKIPMRMRAAGNPGGIGHLWVKERFIDPVENWDELTPKQVRSRKNRIFIPSGLKDNPYLDQEDYLESMEELDPVTRAQLMNGDWEIEAEGNMFKLEWFDGRIISELPNNVKLTRIVRYWDLASTDEEKAKKATGADPDYTASCLLGLGDNGNVYVLEISQNRMTPAAVESLVKTTATADRQKYGARVATWIEQEPGSSGKNTVDFYARHVLLGHNFRGDKPTGNKIERARAASAASENRLVYIIKGAKTKLFLTELQGFPLAAHDDMVDAFSAALIKIAESATIGKEKKPRKGAKRKKIWG